MEEVWGCSISGCLVKNIRFIEVNRMGIAGQQLRGLARRVGLSERI